MPVFRALAQTAGWDYQLVYGALSDISNVPPDGFRATHIKQRFLMGGRLIWVQAQLDYARRRQTDVLIMTWNSRCLSLMPALRRARREGVKTILFGHGFSRFEKGYTRRLRNAIARRADALLTYNHSARERLIGEGFDPQRVFVAQNCLDQSEIERAKQDWLSRPDDLKAFQLKHGLGDGPKLLFVSRITVKTRLDLLIRAAEILRRDHPGLQVNIIGGGDASGLKQLVSDLRLEGVVRFVGAVYGEAELAPWFLSSDLFVYPSAIGLSIFHAFGYGLPVVTDDDLANHNPEIEAMRHDGNGMMYRSNDVESMAMTIRTAMASRERLMSLRAGAIKTVTDNYNLSQLIAGYREAVDAVTTNR